jgi:hypothetical protein
VEPRGGGADRVSHGQARKKEKTDQKRSGQGENKTESLPGWPRRATRWQLAERLAQRGKKRIVRFKGGVKTIRTGQEAQAGERRVQERADPIQGMAEFDKQTGATSAVEVAESSADGANTETASGAWSTEEGLPQNKWRQFGRAAIGQGIANEGRSPGKGEFHVRNGSQKGNQRENGEKHRSGEEKPECQGSTKGCWQPEFGGMVHRRGQRGHHLGAEATQKASHGEGDRANQCNRG